MGMFDFVSQEEYEFWQKQRKADRRAQDAEASRRYAQPGPYDEWWQGAQRMEPLRTLQPAPIPEPESPQPIYQPPEWSQAQRPYEQPGPFDVGAMPQGRVRAIGRFGDREEPEPLDEMQRAWRAAQQSGHPDPSLLSTSLPQRQVRPIEADWRESRPTADEMTAGALEKAGEAVGGAIAQGVQLLPAPAQSGLGTVLDYLGRPQQTIYGAARAAKRGEDVLEGARKGLAGEQHYSGSEMVKEFGGTGNRTGDIIAGLALDVGADPANIVQLGAGGAIRSALGKGAALARKAPVVGKVAEAVEDLTVPLAATRRVSPEAADMLRSLEITKRRAIPTAARDVAGEFGKLPKEVRDSLGKLTEGVTAAVPDTDVVNLLHRLGVDGLLDVPGARDIADRARTFIRSEITGPEGALGIAPATRRNYFPRLAEAGTIPVKPPRATGKAVNTSLKGFAEERLFLTQEAGEAAGVVYRPALEALTKRLGTSKFARESAEAAANLVTGRVKDVDGNSLVSKITPKRNPLKPGHSEFGIRELRGFQAPAEVVEDIERYYKAFLSDSATNALLRVYDGALNLWKGSVTSIYPAFHARNALGNLFNAWLGGFGTVGPGEFIPNPARMVRRLNEARDVQMGGSGTIRAPGAGGALSYDQVRDIAEKAGIRGSGMFGADIPALLERELGERTARDYLNVLALGRQVGTAIEDNAKIGFLLDRLSKGDTVDKAVAQTRKYLFDYSELTPFEKNIMKRVIPFYTWSRKNIPLQLEAVVTQPAKVTAVGKVSNALSEILSGDDAITQAEAELWPKWAAEQLGVQIGRDEQGNPKILSGAGLPIEDVNKLWRGSAGRTLQGLIGETAPMLKAPLEYVLDSSSFTGKHITDPSYQNYYRKASALLADVPGLRDWLELRVESREVLNPRTGQTEERTYYSANPQRMYLLMSLPFARALSTAQKATDPRKTAGDVAVNLLSGGRVASVDLTRATAGYGVDTARVQEKADKNLEDLARRFESGKLGGKEWREIRGQLLGDERAGVGALLQSRPQQEFADDEGRADALRRQLMSEPMQALQEYRSISPEQFGGKMGEFFKARDEFLQGQPPEVRRFIEERGEDYIKNLERTAPTAAKVEREYRQALDDMREYRAIAEMSGLSADELETATDFENKVREFTRSLPPNQRSSRLSFLSVAADDPEGAMAYRFKQRFDKSNLGKSVQKMRQQFWAEHPLLQRYFGNMAMPVETTAGGGQAKQESAFDFENYPYTVK